MIFHFQTISLLPFSSLWVEISSLLYYVQGVYSFILFFGSLRPLFGLSTVSTTNCSVISFHWSQVHPFFGLLHQLSDLKIFFCVICLSKASVLSSENVNIMSVCCKMHICFLMFGDPVRHILRCLVVLLCVMLRCWSKAAWQMITDCVVALYLVRSG